MKKAGRTPVCLLLAAWAAWVGFTLASDLPTIELRELETHGRVFVLSGLSAGEMEHLQHVDLKADPWRSIFSIHVVVENTAFPGERPSLLGHLRLSEGALIFVPRFPLQPGVAYRAVYDPQVMPPGTARTRGVERAFEIPKPQATPRTVVEHVFPSANLLPENLLKFYVHFSAPMRRGESYRHIRLLNSEGMIIQLPFLEIEEELWDPSGSRLTLFFDPGRIKRGLRPREEEGPVLEEGKSYTLVIEREWKDAAGIPMRESYRRSFSVGKPDDDRPDPASWKIRAPQAGARGALILEFPEPMDHAMLERVLLVVDSSGRRIEGEVAVRNGEMEWSFTPREPWSVGRYRIEAETTLEDRSGNSIDRPFEVDVFERVARRDTPRTIQIPFEISS